MTYSLLWTERPESGATSGPGEGSTKTFVYNLGGIYDDVAAWNFSASMFAGTIIAAGEVLYRQKVSIDPKGYGLYVASADYATKKNEVGEYDFDFDTQGGTIHITQSKSTTSFPAGAATDHKGAIDVQGTEVKGTEIVIPALRLTYSFKHPTGVVNEALAVTLARATGRTNSVQWHGFAAGELLFLGATGRGSSTGPATLSYHIAASENVTGLTIGAVTAVAKKGWESVWISYKPAVDGGNNKRAMVPEFVYVERVYDTCAFASILGF